MLISSVNNKKILQLRKLYKSRERKAANVFIAEGVKEVSRGIKSGFKITQLYFCPEIIGSKIDEFLKDITEDTEVYELDRKVYEKVAYRDNTEGVLALFEKKVFSLDDFISDNKGLFIVLEAVEKPGNLGAILRSADATGVSAIILTESKVDQYNPNVIRSSIGAAFTVPVIVSSNEEALNWMKANGVEYYSAALPSFNNLYDLDLRAKIALVFGTESQGLSSFWLNETKRNFTIPMTGIVDSLNVSVSVAVSVYEAIRQRTKNIS